MPRYYPCTCGHSLTAHFSVEHKKYRRGGCKKLVSDANKADRVILCPCTHYVPVKLNAGALNEHDAITVPE